MPDERLLKIFGKHIYNRYLAEREGFEPSIRFCRILTFQASAFDHSATAPHRLPVISCKARSVNRVPNQFALEGAP